MEFILYILAGAAVGFAVGLTGVGGGSLMTPILLLFGFPPHIAVGTDLLYAAVTKAGGVVLHRRQGTIRWRIVTLLLLGSIPASAVTALLLKTLFTDPEAYKHILTTSLGVMLIVTSMVLIFKKKLVANAGQENSGNSSLGFVRRYSGFFTFFMGIALGALVTLSSVGAGAFGAAILLVLYPRLPALNVIGTDLAHAVPLTLVAGLFHLYLGNVDFLLLGALLIGSLPAIWVGTKVGARLPENVLHPILVSILMALGVKYAFF
ncbi:MAG: sulfite exporter TauE/SafE family protein [Pseudomonadales bacterium]|nr:sulfite exporter TauE/SafE family protein [Pseudomonadales bacterium]